MDCARPTKYRKTWRRRSCPANRRRPGDKFADSSRKRGDDSKDYCDTGDDRNVRIAGFAYSLSSEVGATFLAREFWRTPANTESKYLFLRHCFESCAGTCA